MSSLKAHPSYPALKRFKRIYGRSIMATYGAHAMGISWKEEGGEKIPALVLYLTPNKELKIPEVLEIRERGAMDWQRVVVKVVISEVAELE